MCLSEKRPYIILEIVIDLLCATTSGKGDNTEQLMGNHHTNHDETKQKSSPESHGGGVSTRSSVFGSSAKFNSACLIKLFQKLELTADEQNRHPGELSRATFENAFHGPLHTFGKLLYTQMVRQTASGDRERITKEQFTKAGKELLKLYDESSQQEYYFKLFASGKDHLTKEDALQMVKVSYALTLSATMIPYSKGSNDDALFEGIVQGMFGINERVTFQDFTSWSKKNSPHLFCGVHNWVYQILTGSKMPSELEAAKVPQLERFVEDKYTMSMGMLWMLTTVIPQSYTHNPEEKKEKQKSSEKNPLLNSYHLIMKLAQLTRCQSWTLLYDSREHGLSHNRFHHHISSYHGPTITLISFEGRNTYCLALDKPWREGSSRFGGEDSMLIQISPIFRVMQSGAPLVTWNEYSRDLRKGIYLGKEGRSLVLFIPADFDSVEHFGVNCALHKIEMWGCGPSHILEEQAKQKKWEKKEAEKQSAKKLHLDVGKWEENPDKQILQWGGINVEHQYSRDSGF